MSEPKVRLLVVTPLTMNPTASSRLPATLIASAPTPRIGRTENPDWDGATEVGTSRPRSTKWRPFSGICCTVAAVTTCPTTAVARSTSVHLRRDDHGFRSSANGQTEVAHERAADIEVQVFDHLGTKIERVSDDRIRPRSEGGDVVAPLAIGAGGHFESRCRAPDGDNGLGESCSRNIGHAPLQRRRRLGKRKRGVTEQDRCHQCPVAWCSLPACERRVTTGRDHGRRIGGYEQHLPSDLPGINLAPDPVLHGEFLANRGLVAPASAMPRSTPGHPTGVAQEPSLPAVSLPLAGDARRPSCHA